MGKSKLLVLGGKPIGSCELVKKAKEMDCYVIVADYLDKVASPAKQIADECWNVSTGDIETLKNLVRNAEVNGVLAGVHEFNLQKMAVLAQELGLPCYCTEEQQLFCEDKSTFKTRCASFGLDVAREFTEGEARKLDESFYPLAVKPRDGSGSRGFSKCLTSNELSGAIAFAKDNSACGEALIEEFIDADALIAQYTAHEGVFYFCGLTDKFSKKVGSEGAPIMALQIAPSVHLFEYLEKVDSKIQMMLSSLRIEEGPVWLELFYQSDKFVVNEIGYRFGGSLTYHLVRELYDIDQLSLLIDHALGRTGEIDYRGQVSDDTYAIWPLHLRPGRITKVEGMEWLRSQKEFIDLAQVNFIGDKIENWGSAKQVFAYLHLRDDNMGNLVSFMCDILRNVRVLDEEGVNILFSLFDPREEKDYPGFLKEDLALERSR